MDSKEHRIKRRAKRLFGESERTIQENMERLGIKGLEAGKRVGRRLYLETQKRKGEGKEILKKKAMSLLFGTKNDAKTLLYGSRSRRRRQ